MYETATMVPLRSKSRIVALESPGCTGNAYSTAFIASTKVVHGNTAALASVSRLRSGARRYMEGDWNSTVTRVEGASSACGFRRVTERSRVKEFRSDTPISADSVELH